MTKRYFYTDPLAAAHNGFPGPHRYAQRLLLAAHLLYLLETGRSLGSMSATVGRSRNSSEILSASARAGLDAARARGRKGGRPKKLDSQQRALAIDLYNQKKHGVDEICRTVGISKPTLYAYLKNAHDFVVM
jgi:Helix-turn-helix domain of resolvase